MTDTILPNTGLTQPTVGADFGTWGTVMNANLAILDGLNWTGAPNDGKQITSASININGDLIYNTHNITGVRSLRLVSNGAALSAGSDLNCLYDVNGDVWWNNAAGTQVQLTSGGALNVILNSPITFPVGTTTPTIIQTTSNASSATGQNMIIDAQAMTGTSSVGGKLSLNAGDGVATGGNVAINAGNGTTTGTVNLNVAGVNYLNVGANGLGSVLNTLNITGGTVTPTAAQLTPILFLSGTLSSDCTLVLPNVPAIYFFICNGITYAGHVIKVKTGVITITMASGSVNSNSALCITGGSSGPVAIGV